MPYCSQLCLYEHSARLEKTNDKTKKENDGKRVTDFASSDLPVIHCVPVKMGEKVWKESYRKEHNGRILNRKWVCRMLVGGYAVLLLLLALPGHQWDCTGPELTAYRVHLAWAGTGEPQYSAAQHNVEAVSLYQMYTVCFIETWSESHSVVYIEASVPVRLNDLQGVLLTHEVKVIVLCT